jgi:kynurenine formamidase
MKLWATTFALLSILASTLSAQSTDAAKLIDLSYAFGEQTIYWPTEAGFKLERGSASITERGYFYAANRFECAEHGGTHIDAPRHFWETGETVDQIPLSRLVGSGACVDVSAKCAIDRDYQVTVEDFQAWETANSTSLEGRIVIIRTGFGLYWPNRQRYLGTAETGAAAVAQLHFPGLDPSAAEWLITRRHIRMVGIDTASIDHGQTHDYPTHVRLFRDGVPALENVANAGLLPAKGFTIIALPMKIEGGSGAPCRVVAMMDSEQ